MPSPVLATTTDPGGREIVLDEEAWSHVLGDHGEMDAHRGAVMATVARPDDRQPDPRPGRERFYRPRLWPGSLAVRSRRLQRVARAGSDRVRPLRRATGMAQQLPIALQVGGLAFDHSSYDARGDVLYLHVGQPSTAGGGQQTPEGHVVRYDEGGQVVGLTIINARWLLERDGALAVTVPERVEVDSDTLAPALAPA